MSDRNLTTRLNYQVSTAAEERLTEYCSLSGRSASDVVRQVICEFLDGTRALGAVGQLEGRRTNCTLPATIVGQLDAFVSKLGPGATKGAVISSLLENWTPDSAVATEILRGLVSAVRNGEYKAEALQNAEDFLGIERGQKDG